MSEKDDKVVDKAAKEAEAKEKKDAAEAESVRKVVEKAAADHKALVDKQREGK